MVESTSFHSNSRHVDSSHMARIRLISYLSYAVLRLLILFEFRSSACPRESCYCIYDGFSFQGLQFYYQRGCLYRLRALGETHDMDVTIEGFHRWMFRKAHHSRRRSKTRSRLHFSSKVAYRFWFPFCSPVIYFNYTTPTRYGSYRICQQRTNGKFVSSPSSSLCSFWAIY